MNHVNAYIMPTLGSQHFFPSLTLYYLLGYARFFFCPYMFSFPFSFFKVLELLS